MTNHFADKYYHSHHLNTYKAAQGPSLQLSNMHHWSDVIVDISKTKGVMCAALIIETLLLDILQFLHMLKRMVFQNLQHIES